MEASAEVRPLKLLWAAASRTIDDLCARLLEDAEEDAPLAIRPGRLIGVLRADDRLADIAHPQCAIAVGNDCVVPILGPDQLVVGVNREDLAPLSIAPLGSSTVVAESGVRTSSSDDPLATSLAGSSWMRTAGFC
jgi:hypothetical protein